MEESREEPAAQASKRKRRLRAVLAADIANFGGLVSVDETKTLDALWITRRVATEELEAHGGWLFGMPGDGIFALFESAVDAVRCAIKIQERLASMPKLNALRMRIGVHLGEVLFQDGLPFGESLVIAARLESLADPGGILISSSVMDAVASRISATFSENGVRSLKHSPRRIATFSVTASPGGPDLDVTASGGEPLDRSVMSAPAERPERLEPPPEKARPSRAIIDASLIAALPKATPFQVLVPKVGEDPPGPSVPEPLAEPAVMAPAVMAPAVTAPAEIAPAAMTQEAARGPAAPALDATPDAVSPAGLAELARVLTTHVGPVAKLLVRRHAADTPAPGKLIKVLAQEIPAETERHDFIRRAHDALSALSSA